jgi:CheY-like chemotaxis protein/HPt (histidine-containing phosphotransfer) domain-containing protein
VAAGPVAEVLAQHSSSSVRVRVEAGVDLASAAQALRERSFDLVLLDLRLPEGSGLDLLPDIDALQPFATVVHVASASSGIDVGRARALGAHTFLFEPLTQSDLLETLLLAVQALHETPAVGDHGTPDVRTPVRLTDGGGLTILVAEDHEVNQKLMAKLVVRQGHRMTLARDGLEAVRLFEENHYDVILMDLQMPGLSGLEATARVREIERAQRLPRTPIIALTANAMKETREECLAGGMDGYVTKPVQFALLAAEIHRVLDDESLAQTPIMGSRIIGPAEHPPLDPQRLLEAVDGDRVFLEHIAGLFMDDCKQRLNAIERHLAKRDAKSILLEAHTLKGSAGMFTAFRMMHLALTLEEDARQDLRRAPSLLVQLRHERRAVARALEHHFSLEVKKTPAEAQRSA